MGLFEILLAICGFVKYNKVNSDTSTFKNILNRNPVPSGIAYKGTYTHPKLINKNILPIVYINEKNNKTEKINVFSSILSWTYTCFVMSVLLINPLSKILYNPSLPATKFFSCIPVTQFLFGINYHSTDHFDTWWEKNPECNTTKNKLAGVITSIFILEWVAFVLFDKESYTWYEYPSKIFGFLVMTTFTAEFWYVFYKHSYVLTKFAHFLANGDSNMNELLKKVTEIKFDLDNSIGAFKNNFAVTSILGSVPVAYAIMCIKNIDCEENFPWVFVGFFAVYHIVFFILIRYIENRKEEINRVVKHTDFIRKYLSRLDNKDVSELYNNDTNMILLDIVEENSTSIDWMLFNQMSSDRWSKFSVLGMGLSDGEIFQKGAFLVGIIIVIQNFINFE